MDETDSQLPRRPTPNFHKSSTAIEIHRTACTLGFSVCLIGRNVK